MTSLTIPQTGAAPASFSRAEEHDLLDRLFDRLWPLLRSITGPGIEASIAIIGEHLPLSVEKVPSGTQAFDWLVPDEWHCRGARLVGPGGKVVCDLADNNLHVVNYSDPVDRHLSLAELQPHLHSMPQLPEAIPYVTSYYKRDWGFCLADQVRKSLPDGQYHAKIDSTFVKGGVPLAETVLPGEIADEVMITSYLCHPSLANNELSGPLALTALYRRIAAWPRRRYSYRFVLGPETIGSICYLYRHGEHLRRSLATGLILTSLGGPSDRLSYKMARRDDALLNRLITHLAAADAGKSAGIDIRPFTATGGSDERQYCSPGFNLPVGQIARSVHGKYLGYHNSLDDKASMGIDSVVRSIEELEQLLLDHEIAGRFINLSPFGEPQLGKRGLYPNTNSSLTRQHSDDTAVDGRVFLERLLTMLNYCDGEHDMISIAERLNCSVRALRPVIERLEAAQLLRLASRMP